MPIDKKDYQNFQESLESTVRPAQSRINFDLLKRESARSGALVGSPEWDTFLGYIESIIKTHREIADQARASLEDSKVVSYENLIHSKMILREASAVVRNLEQIVQLPYAIIHERSMLEDVVSKIPAPEVPDFFKTEK